MNSTAPPAPVFLFGSSDFSQSFFFILGCSTKLFSILCIPLLACSLYVIISSNKDSQLKTTFHGFLSHIQAACLIYIFSTIIIVDIPFYGFFLDFYKANGNLFGSLSIVLAGVARFRETMEVLVALERVTAIFFPMKYTSSIFRYTFVFSIIICLYSMILHTVFTLIMKSTYSGWKNAVGASVIVWSIQPQYIATALWVQSLIVGLNTFNFGCVCVIYTVLLTFIMIQKQYQYLNISKVAIKLSVVGFTCSLGELLATFVLGSSSFAYRIASVNLIDTRVYWTSLQIARDISFICYTLIPLMAFAPIRKRIINQFRSTVEKSSNSVQTVQIRSGPTRS